MKPTCLTCGYGHKAEEVEPCSTCAQPGKPYTNFRPYITQEAAYALLEAAEGARRIRSLWLPDEFGEDGADEAHALIDMDNAIKQAIAGVKKGADEHPPSD